MNISTKTDKENQKEFDILENIFVFLLSVRWEHWYLLNICLLNVMLQPAAG